MAQTALFRVDSSSQIGLGHLMRCLALAETWQSAGGQAVFVTNCSNKQIMQRLESKNIEVVPAQFPDLDLGNMLNILGKPQRGCGQIEDSWLILDGYHFDSGLQRDIRSAGWRLLVIDDVAHLDHYYTDVILNQNINSQELSYQSEPDTHFLLGTKYVLLRSEFLQWRGIRSDISKTVSRIIVTMGGSDTHNQSLDIINSLKTLDLSGLDIMVLVGPSNPHITTLRRAIEGHINFRLKDDSLHLPAIMAWADLAITGAGATCWELAFMGLPMVTIVLAQNQTGVAEGLQDAGIAMNLGWFNELQSDAVRAAIEELSASPQRRCDMSRLGRNLIDGGGSQRVVSYLRDFVSL